MHPENFLDWIERDERVKNEISELGKLWEVWIGLRLEYCCYSGTSRVGNSRPLIRAKHALLIGILMTNNSIYPCSGSISNKISYSK